MTPFPTQLRRLLARFSAWAAKIDPCLALIFLAALFALWPLLAPGYFFGAHDGRHSVFFVSMFDEAIRDGALWPRWAMHHNAGYGYPTFIVQAPLTFYVAEFFILLGAGITTAVKLTWAAGFLVGGLGMYRLIREWGVGSGEWGVGIGDRGVGSGDRGSGIGDRGVGIGDRGSGIGDRGVGIGDWGSGIGALLYIFIPYHLLDIYVRAALAETTLMAWFPWVILAFDRLIVRGAAPGWLRRLLLAALAYAGLLLTHVVALIAFTPLLIAFVLFRLWTVRRTFSPPVSRSTSRAIRTAQFAPLLLSASAGLAALLLAAIFLLPLLAEGPLLDQSVYTGNTYSYTRHWVQFSQFFDPFWGYGFSDDPVGANDGMGFQVGLLALLLAFVSGLGLWQMRRKRDFRWWLETFLLLMSGGLLLFITPLAEPIWWLLPMVEVIQFPWRLLALSSFTLSALGGLAAARLLANTGREMAGGGVVVALLILFASGNFTHPESMQPVEMWREDGRAVYQFEQQHPDMLGYTRWVEQPFTQSAMTPQYAAEGFENGRLERLGILTGEGRLLGHYSRGHSFGGEVEMASAGVVQIRVYFFPGWQVRLDGQPVAHRLSPPDGLTEIDVPVGRHRVDMRMGSTPVRSAGLAISGLTLLLLLALAGRGERAERGWHRSVESA